MITVTSITPMPDPITNRLIRKLEGQAQTETEFIDGLKTLFQTPNAKTYCKGLTEYTIRINHLEIQFIGLPVLEVI